MFIFNQKKSYLSRALVNNMTEENEILLRIAARPSVADLPPTEQMKLDAVLLAIPDLDSEGFFHDLKDKKEDQLEPGDSYDSIGRRMVQLSREMRSGSTGFSAN